MIDEQRQAEKKNIGTREAAEMHARLLRDEMPRAQHSIMAVRNRTACPERLEIDSKVSSQPEMQDVNGSTWQDHAAGSIKDPAAG
jgi:hypothetical protein